MEIRYEIYGLKTGWNGSWWCQEYLQGFSSWYGADECIIQIITFIICIAIPLPRTVDVDWSPPCLHFPPCVLGTVENRKKIPNYILECLIAETTAVFWWGNSRMMWLWLWAGQWSNINIFYPFLSFIKPHNKWHIRGEILTTYNWLCRTVWLFFRGAFGPPPEDVFLAALCGDTARKGQKWHEYKELVI